MNPSASSGSLLQSMIIEGFICPECQQDMTSVELLQAHFELMHLNNSKNASSSSSDNRRSGGANNQVAPAAHPSASGGVGPYVSLAASSLTSTMAPSALAAHISSSFLKQYFNANQQTPHSNSLTSEFRRLRDNTVGRYVIQTNKLLITLDKLISIDLALYVGETEREIHYKSIVSWANDKDVKLCPNCAKTFNMLVRRHHCRLCGAIMCNKCSQFISFQCARQLTDPDAFVKACAAAASSPHGATEPTFRLKRSDSITSVNSYFFKSKATVASLSLLGHDGDETNHSNNNNNNNISKNPTKVANPDQVYLRLCFDCGAILEKKYKSFRDKVIRPEFANMYDELHVTISECRRLYPIYTKIAESLSAGEAVHQLEHADEMRHRLIRLFQKIESVSGALLKFGGGGAATAGAESPATATPAADTSTSATVSNDHLKLQRNIRFYAINYLKEHSFTLSALPNRDEYAKLKAQRQVYLREEMRRAELEQLKQKKQLNDQVAKTHQQQQLRKPQTTTTTTTTTTSSTSRITVDSSNGWIPSVIQMSQLTDHEDDVSGAHNGDRAISVTAAASHDNSHQPNKGDGSGVDGAREHDAIEVKRVNALRTQIQLVEGYLQDAIKHNKQDEIGILQKNLNELHDILVNK